MKRAYVAATGAALPGRRLTTAEIETRHGMRAGTLESATGIRERRIVEPGTATSDLAVQAAQQALDADGSAEDVRLLILATGTPDHPLPATAPRVAAQLGLDVPAFDLSAACSGFVYGLAMADGYLRSWTGGGSALVVGATVLSPRLDWRDPLGASLYGDGAGAVLVRVHDGPEGLQTTHLASDGNRWQQIHVPAGGTRRPLTPEGVASGEHLMQTQKGRQPFDASLDLLVRSGRHALEASGLGASDLDLLVPSQSTRRMVEGAARALGVPEDRLHFHADRYANMSSAAIPVALHESAEGGRLQHGSRILLASVGAGLVSAGAVLTWATEVRP